MFDYRGRSRCLILLGFLLGSLSARADDYAVILIYHHVAADTPEATSVTPDVFGRHMDLLEREGFTVWPLLRVFENLDRGEPLPEKTVALTFDDGYASVRSTAAPLLAERGWPFTIFVSPDAIDGGYALQMSWDDLRALTKDGAQVANHTLSHDHLVRRMAGERPADWERRVRDEIDGAQQRIAAEIGSAPPLFAYPYGEFDRDLERVVADLGYFAVGQHSGAVGPASDLHAAPRFPFATGFDGLDEFALRVRSRPLPVREPASSSAVVTAGESPELRLAIGSGDFRLADLACYASSQGRMTVQRIADREYSARPQRPLGSGRNKYNCTAPASAESGVYYWFSYLWLTKNRDGSWYEE
jgi:peptidoglycan/xylan/chitin deacetylase (PgdA/CDA1 family)